MELYKKITVKQQVEEIGSHTELLTKDAVSVWEAMADNEEKVTLSKNYGESITINDRGVAGAVRILTHVGENVHFQHIYSLVE